MAYTEFDRSGIRWALGYSAIFLQADPSLEVAITASQSVADLGSRPDSNGENFVKGCLYGFAAQAGSAGVPQGPGAQVGPFAVPARRGLYAVWAAIDQLDVFMGALEADGGEVKVDGVREMVRLRSEGRRLVHTMARMLSTAVVVDIFGPAQIEPGGNSHNFNRPETAFSGFYALRERSGGRLW